MPLNAKEAANRLLAIADAMEKEASEKTFFVCDSCLHTASMSSINGTRSKFASENGIETIANVTIQDTLSCSCGGDMKYAATEESEKFFIDEPEEDETAEDLDETEVADETVEDTEEPAADLNDEEVVVEDEEVSEEDTDEKPKKNTTKDKKDSDGKVELKDAPEVQFGDDDKKSSKTAFDKAVSRYSEF